MSKTTDLAAVEFLVQGLLKLAERLEPKEVAEVAASVTQAVSKTRNPDILWYLAPTPSAVVARLEPKEAAEVAATIVQAMSKATDQPLKRLKQNLSAVLARELPPQTLVDLLKHPCCVGEARRLVLDQLARHYQRPFADQWDFVDYVQQQKLPLDLTTPPARSRILP
jgi:hypothetical protein